MSTAKAMTEKYEANFKVISKYVHATSRGHEAVQIALGMHLLPQDYLSAYYRDDALLLSIGMEPYDLMLQLMAKKDDPFSGGRAYYSHPSLKDDDKVKILHQSSATGMQAIPIAGAAMGLQYKKGRGLVSYEKGQAAIAVCSIGDASMTEGEVSEALQMAALKQLPLLFVVQDNGWDISATAEETRAMNAAEYAKGFPGIEAMSIDGNNFKQVYKALGSVIKTLRTEQRPFLVHTKVPLLNHHTSGVRMEWYRDDLEEHQSRDPYPILKNSLLKEKINPEQIAQIEKEAVEKVDQDFDRSMAADNPVPQDLYDHIFAPTPIQEERGTRNPAKGEEKVMVDCALFAIQQIMDKDASTLFYGQDVGGRLGGVFREAATLAQKFGDDRVFNTAIQEAFIVGSTVGMSGVGLKPMVEVQFADYIWPGMNQLFTEVSRSCYLSNGKYPVNMILRVPIGAYGSGGPYHSSSVESVVCNIKGLKVAYPSNGADLFGFLQAAYQDPNPVVLFEHKGLYWSKVKGTDAARSILPSPDYVVPFGKARTFLHPDEEKIKNQNSIGIVTYGMGVHWSINAAKNFDGLVEVLDLRSLHPLDEEAIYTLAQKHHRVLVVTEEPVNNSFAQSIAARIQENCFEYLDAPVRTLGAENVPAVPLAETLERTMIPSIEKVEIAMEYLLEY